MANGKVIGSLLAVVALALVTYMLIDNTGSGSPEGSAEIASDAMSVASQNAGNGQTWIGGLEGSQVYEIDPDQSEVYWRVYRDGPMARFGHNHMISVGEMEGSVLVGENIAESSWELTVPVTGLIIDDPDLRARYGEDFESVPSEEDKTGTKENMLTEGVLDGVNFPEIRLEGSGFEGSLESASLPVSISMLGRTIERTFAAAIVIADEVLTVTGEHSLTHTDLGLEPFSVFGGAMAVGEDIDITFRLHAERVTP